MQGRISTTRYILEFTSAHLSGALISNLTNFIYGKFVVDPEDRLLNNRERDSEKVSHSRLVSKKFMAISLK